MLRTCATKFCASAIIPPSCCGARATRAIRRPKSTPLCATLFAEVDPARRYQPNSTDGPGVRSHGPYYWRAPREFYTVYDDYFKTETGSASVPTLESIHGMMPEKDWETINDDWAAHDLAKGNQHGDLYPLILAGRYGKIANLADFVRKAQMMNYEAFRAMYEGRNAQLFHPTTAVITWMSNPAQPSFVWQIYHYDLEPMSSYFAVMHASEIGAHPVQRSHGQCAGHQQQARARGRTARARRGLQPRRLARLGARNQARCRSRCCYRSGPHRLSGVSFGRSLHQA